MANTKLRLYILTTGRLYDAGPAACIVEDFFKLTNDEQNSVFNIIKDMREGKIPKPKKSDNE